MDWAQWGNVITSGLIAACALAFVTVYQLRAPWRSTSAGRHVMAVTAVIGAFGLYTVLIAVWPHGPAAAALRVVRVVVGLWMAGLLVQRTRMVLRAQRDGAGSQPGQDEKG